VNVTETDTRIVAGMATQGQALRRLLDAGAHHLVTLRGAGTACVGVRA
jgi:hypothetical protein